MVILLEESIKRNQAYENAKIVICSKIHRNEDKLANQIRIVPMGILLGLE